MRIKSLTVQNMWSFGKPTQHIPEFGKTTIIIGKNNSGKSNVLKALHWLGEHKQWATEPGILSTVRHEVIHQCEGEAPDAIRQLVLGVSLSELESKQFLRDGKLGDYPDELIEEIEGALVCGIRINFKAAPRSDEAPAPCTVDFIDADGAPCDVPSGKVALGDKAKPFKQKFMSNLRQYLADTLTRKTIALRGSRSLEAMRIKNQSITSFLREIKSPPMPQRQNREVFSEIERLFKRLTGLACASLEPQATKEILQVDEPGRYLPISSLGDGIAHLLMLAIELATRKDSLFLIEEPEIHLHPGLQRHLLDFMNSDANSNQCVITTHSPVFLDSGFQEPIYRVDHDGKTSNITKCETTEDHYMVLDALDVRASDILQANVAVWVEGPTDRIFLKKCLQLKAEGLTEGIDYQLVEYGGDALAHLTLDDQPDDGLDDQLKHLVGILSLARHAAVICDSDRKRKGDPISAHKERIRQECQDKGGLLWVTEGREMENYICDRVLTEAFREYFKEPGLRIRLRMYEKLAEKVAQLDLSGGEQGPKPNYGRNKVKVMRLVVKHLKETDLEQSDLSERLEELIEYIRRANRTSEVGPAG